MTPNELGYEIGHAIGYLLGRSVDLVVLACLLAPVVLGIYFVVRWLRRRQGDEKDDKTP